MRPAVRLALLLGLPAAFTLACSTSGGSAGDGSAQLQGRIALEVYEAPVCGDAGLSLLGRCSRETYTGTLEGDGDVAVASIDPLETDGVVAITENEVIHLPDGDLSAQVDAVYQAESPDRAFVSLHTITGGKGKYAGASGHIRVWGSAASEQADYVAAIHLAK